jgi:hypothetical protein
MFSLHHPDSFLFNVNYWEKNTENLRCVCVKLGKSVSQRENESMMCLEDHFGLSCSYGFFTLQ